MPFGSDYGTLADLPMNLGRAILNAGQTMISAPRQAVWDLGPTLVGRSGQGPQNGSELLGRLGADPTTPVGQIFGTGIDMVADPINLMLPGSGLTTRQTVGHMPAPSLNLAARASGIAEGSGSALARRLEQHAGGGLAGELGANAARSGPLPGGLADTIASGASRNPGVAEQMATRGAPGGPARPLPRPAAAPVAPGPSWGGQVADQGALASGVSPSWLQGQAPVRGFGNYPPLSQSLPATGRLLDQPAAGAMQSRLANRLAGYARPAID